jgi:hypothetical protein
MPDVFYRQCSLRRMNGQVDVAWIPEKFAVKGKYLRIKRGEKWENGWQVTGVYGREAEAHLFEHERDYLRQRVASDV